MIILAKRIIVGDGRSILLDHGLLISPDGRIAAIGKRADLAAQHPEEEVLDYPDCTLLPGLIDMFFMRRLPKLRGGSRQGGSFDSPAFDTV